MQVSAAVRKMQEEVEARQQAEAEAARLAEEQRIRVGPLTLPPTLYFYMLPSLLLRTPS